ncbi:hypothetical protein BTJ48_04538 [Bacillus mycoides]|uniref:hypothetical protein n=2 Tax=Bacillus mycoides TaxID=1405 RepID=UPI000A27E9A4|nr:hypothetical protein [Bacillus mycoides]OSY04313.1 hypothetical protein BTJ48_04538 [Bacillus mycoides]HDR7648183.1 hypothetical protein [Bacillus mycoides]
MSNKSRINPLVAIEMGLDATINKQQPTIMNDEAINRYISDRNRPIVVATPHSIMRFKKRKEEENPAE